MIRSGVETLEGVIFAHLGVLSVGYTALRSYIPFLVLFSTVIVALALRERRSLKVVARADRPRGTLKRVTVLIYATIAITVAGVTLWDLAVALFAEGHIAEDDVAGRLRFLLRPELLAIENLIRYGGFLLVPIALLLREKPRRLFSAIFASPKTAPGKTILLSTLCAVMIPLLGMVIVYSSVDLAGDRVVSRDPFLGLSLEGLIRRLAAVSPVVAVVCAAVLVLSIASSEELIFRGIIYSVIRERMGVVWALVLESGMFSAYHYASLGTIYMVHLFVAGVCLTALFEITKSIYPSIAIHGVLLLLSIVLGTVAIRAS